MEFPKLTLARSCALSLANDPSYVLHFAVQSGDLKETKLFAAAVSGSNEIKLYNKETFCSQGVLLGNTAGITSIKFDISNPDVLWSTSHDGGLRYWNVTNKDCGSNVVSKLDIGYLSLDISCDGSLLAVGTERVEEDEEKTVFVEFWDIRNLQDRNPKCLAKFEDIHSDDITKILFHPTNPKIVATGSTDGLIAILDLTTYDEEDALIHTLNTESSVSTMGFFGPSFEFLYTLTHIETLQIWKHTEGELITAVADLRMKSPKANTIDYVIDCVYYATSQRLFLIGGTHRGSMEIFHVNLDVIEPYQSLSGGHSSTVRCVIHEPQCLLTGAEDGMVCAWMPIDGVSHSSKVKAKPRKKKERSSKPYK